MINKILFDTHDDSELSSEGVCSCTHLKTKSLPFKFLLEIEEIYKVHCITSFYIYILSCWRVILIYIHTRPFTYEYLYLLVLVQLLKNGDGRHPCRYNLVVLL